MYENETKEEEEARRRAREQENERRNPRVGPITALRRLAERNPRKVIGLFVTGGILVGLKTVGTLSSFAYPDQEADVVVLEESNYGVPEDQVEIILGDEIVDDTDEARRRLPTVAAVAGGNLPHSRHPVVTNPQHTSKRIVAQSEKRSTTAFPKQIPSGHEHLPPTPLPAAFTNYQNGSPKSDLSVYKIRRENETLKLMKPATKKRLLKEDEKRLSRCREEGNEKKCKVIQERINSLKSDDPDAYVRGLESSKADERAPPGTPTDLESAASHQDNISSDLQSAHDDEVAHESDA